MLDNNIVCLIIGETPGIQFLGWRMGLGNSFMILVSECVSSDGLVAWKSSKMGANFYTPHIFTKDIDSLPSKLIDSVTGNLKYEIDLIIISSISISEFQRACAKIKQYATEDTTIVVSADFGCELELIALEHFKNNCRCVLSVVCDLECRQLSLGSYALIGEENCNIFMGLTYSENRYKHDTLLSNNERKVRSELEKSQTGVKCAVFDIVRLLEMTPWIKVQLICDPIKMIYKVWDLLIPKISLNLLAIVYEEFDFRKLLENPSTRIVFRGIVWELLQIMQIQTGEINSKYLISAELGNEEKLTEENINFDMIITNALEKSQNTASFTSNEHPEYLTLPFEAYCFFHKLEYPAQILLKQPLNLAHEFNMKCFNLNFLYGFYTRLLSMAGISINGGRSEPTILTINSKLGMNVAIELDDSTDERTGITRESSTAYVETTDQVLEGHNARSNKIGIRRSQARNYETSNRNTTSTIKNHKSDKSTKPKTASRKKKTHNDVNGRGKKNGNKRKDDKSKNRTREDGKQFASLTKSPLYPLLKNKNLSEISPAFDIGSATLPPELENLYLGAENLSFASPKSPDNMISCSIPDHAASASSLDGSYYTDFTTSSTGSSETDANEKEHEGSGDNNCAHNTDNDSMGKELTTKSRDFCVTHDKEANARTLRKANKGRFRGSKFDQHGTLEDRQTVTFQEPGFFMSQSHFKHNSGEKELKWKANYFCDSGILEDEHGAEYLTRESRRSKPLEHLGILSIPHFIKRFRKTKTCGHYNPDSSNRSRQYDCEDDEDGDDLEFGSYSANESRPYTTASLELQICSNQFQTSKEYQELQRQLNFQTTPPSREAYNLKRKQYAVLEKKMWVLQRRFLMSRNVVKHSSRGKFQQEPYDELLNHIEILNKANAGGILEFTTNRYATVDTFNTIQLDRERIMSLFQAKQDRVERERLDSIKLIKGIKMNKSVQPEPIYDPKKGISRKSNV